MKSRTLNAMVGALALLASAGASADYDWTFSPGSGSVPYGPYSAAGTSTTVVASGWQNSNYSSNSGSSYYGSGNLQNVSGSLTYYGGSGLGVYDGGSPQHAVDNDGRIESILLSFSSAVTLSQVRFGWVGGSPVDYDFTLAAYTPGTGDPTPGLTSLQYADLATNGWGLIESHSNGESTNVGGDQVFGVNGGDVSSSYWLISALNPKLDPANSNLAGARDYFKLYSVSGKQPTTPPPPASIPEPSVVSLFLLGLLLAGYLRKRNGSREMLTLKA